MQAVVVRSFGGPESLEICEVPLPDVGPGQVRIRVEAATVNPVDAMFREGVMAQYGLDVPLGLGWDVAGHIDEVGPDVTSFGVGDPVIGLRDGPAAFADDRPIRTGTQAEYVTLTERAVARAPASAPPTEAAGLPLNGLTAWQALDLLEIPAGGTLLVTGAAGAVGGYAVELGRARGLRVIGAAGASDEELVRRLGGDVFVPRSSPLGAAVRRAVPDGVDGVVDAAAIGGDAIKAVRDDGAFASVVVPTAPDTERGIRVLPVQVDGDGTQLAQLARLVDDGRLTLRTSAIYPLADIARAHKRLAEGGVRGRMMVIP